MRDPLTLDAARERYADAIAAASKLRSKALHDAFGRVPREAFLGPGPWSIGRFDGPAQIATYERTPDDDPVRVYVDAVIAIDEARQLNNGLPSFLAACLDELDLVRGDRFVHVGCGTGYYTAVAADVVDTEGEVLALEIDPDLAARAVRNLLAFNRVRVVNADASDTAFGPADAIFINAGATQIKRCWLDALDAGARMLLPLTTDRPSMSPSIGIGRMLKLVRQDDRIDARFVSSVGMYHCAGARDAQTASALSESLARNDAGRVTTLRTDPHERCATCWLHMPTGCLSV